MNEPKLKIIVSNNLAEDISSKLAVIRLKLGKTGNVNHMNLNQMKILFTFHLVTRRPDIKVAIGISRIFWTGFFSLSLLWAYNYRRLDQNVDDFTS